MKLLYPDGTINIADILPNSRIYGPGKRFVIWVQGCALHCHGCWNKDMWSFGINQLYNINILYEMITEQDDIEGITILGGEPLHQSKALMSLVKLLKTDGYSIMLYTGFDEDEIHDVISKNLVSHSDIVIFGRYLDDSRSTFLRWRGSSNQNIWINEHSPYKHIQEHINDKVNEIEVHIHDDGDVTIVGYPEKELFECVVI